MATDKRVKIDIKVTTNIPGTPIFDQLAEEFTQFYADHVLARKVEADINPPKEEEQNDEAAEAIGHGDDAGGTHREGDVVAE